MLAVFSITAPIFILIGLGYFAARIGLLERQQIRGMGTFVISFALPSLVLKAMLDRSFSEIFNINYLIAFTAASVLVYAIGFAWGRWVRKESFTVSALLAGGMATSNSGFIGYPVALSVVGSSAALAMALGMIIENTVLIPLILALSEIGQHKRTSLLQLVRTTALRLIKSPVIIAINLGLLMALLEWKPPTIVMKPIEMLAAASAPVALFVIGGSVYGMRIDNLWQDIAQTSAGKLLLHPILVATAMFLMPGIDPTLKIAGVLFASAPMMSIFPILGQAYGQEQRCAASLLAATTLAFFTISSVIALIRYMGLVPV